jgi:hypothetical protein
MKNHYDPEGKNQGDESPNKEHYRQAPSETSDPCQQRHSSMPLALGRNSENNPGQARIKG